MKATTSDYKLQAVGAMESAVSLGAFKATTRPSKEARELVFCCLERIKAYSPPVANLRVLECGCGSGAWLELILEYWKDLGPAAVHGFDLTPALVKEAKKRLGSLLPAKNLACGDILENASYAFGTTNEYNLIYCYDVVQQLPRRLQSSACQTMYNHLAAGGCLLVFDHDKWSRYGIMMGLKKALRRYLGIPLVPRYYCSARYPDLDKLAKSLREIGAECEIFRIDGIPKRTLIARRRDSSTSGNEIKDQCMQASKVPKC
jgi:SAM-dependent methyltransferase